MAKDLTGVAMCDALVIATPVSTHHGLARAALEAGQHVLVAKPLTSTLAEAEELAALAADLGLVLMVDHTFVHTGAVRRIAQLVAEGELGRPLYYDSVRVNLGLFQQDADVVWDLAPHDLAILAAVFPQELPVAVTCRAFTRAGGERADLAYLTVEHESGFVAHCHLSWLSPVKIRRTLIGGARRMVVYDDMEPSEKVRVYDAGVTVAPGPDTHRALVDYRIGDCWAPHLDFTEALQVELAAFAALCAHTAPGSEHRNQEAHAGVNGVRLLEAASRSAEAGGERVPG